MENSFIHKTIGQLHHHSARVLCMMSVIVSLCFAVGCVRDKDETLVIERAESLLRNNPQEALSLMESIDRSTIHENSELAYYALVYSEACYYNRKLVDAKIAELEAALSDAAEKIDNLTAALSEKEAQAKINAISDMFL